MICFLAKVSTLLWVPSSLFFFRDLSLLISLFLFFFLLNLCSQNYEVSDFSHITKFPFGFMYLPGIWPLSLVLLNFINTIVYTFLLSSPCTCYLTHCLSFAVLHWHLTYIICPLLCSTNITTLSNLYAAKFTEYSLVLNLLVLASFHTINHSLFYIFFIFFFSKS